MSRGFFWTGHGQKVGIILQLGTNFHIGGRRNGTQ